MTIAVLVAWKYKSSQTATDEVGESLFTKKIDAWRKRKNRVVIELLSRGIAWRNNCGFSLSVFECDGLTDSHGRSSGHLNSFFAMTTPAEANG